MSNERMHAELKAFAVKAGIVDVDGLQLADVSEVRFNDRGQLVGAHEAVEKLRASKPYLFSPASMPPAPKKVSEMSHAEYAAERKKRGLR
jgi:hypothetical protein